MQNEMNDRKIAEGRTILFVDDDLQLRKFVANVLTGCGYVVLVAESGTQALQISREHTSHIDLLLTDIDMPGMTGIELSIQINRERPEIKILLISGMESGLLVLNNGWQFMPKPFVALSLRDRIRDFLDEQTPIENHLPKNMNK